MDFCILYSNRKGDKLECSTDFLEALTTHNCIYLGTGRAGSSLNSIIEHPICIIANSVSKLSNAGL